MKLIKKKASLYVIYVGKISKTTKKDMLEHVLLLHFFLASSHRMMQICFVVSQVCNPHHSKNQYDKTSKHMEMKKKPTNATVSGKCEMRNDYT